MVKAIVRNFYMTVNVRFTQATTRGDDTTLIKLVGTSIEISDTSRGIFQYISLLLCLSTGDIPALVHRK